MNKRLSYGVVLILLLMAAPSRADDKADAQKHFGVGLSLLKSDDFSGAQIEFEASIALYPTKGAIYNLANCYRAQHRYEKAISNFDRLLEQYADSLDEEMRVDINQQLTELRDLIAELDIQVNTVGATVFLNGEEKGLSPLKKPLLLGPGEYRLGIELDGYVREEQLITLTSGDRKTVSIELKPVAVESETPPEEIAVETDSPTAQVAEPPSEPAPVPEKVESDNSPLKITGIAALGVGGAAVVGGVVTGIIALKRDNTLDENCPDQKCASSYQSDIDDLNTMTTVTNVLLFGGAAVAVGGAALWMFAIFSQNNESVDMALAPRIGPDFAGAVLRTEF